MKAGAATIAALVLLAAASAAQAASTHRVSVNSAFVQGNGKSGNEPGSLHPVSSGGQYVAFASDASNLVANDTNGARDIFVRDRQTGVTERISVSASEAQGNGDSTTPAISANGQYVAFASSSSNLVSGDSNGVQDIFVRDRVNGSTFRASIGASGAQPNGHSFTPSIAVRSEEIYVGFSSAASNLLGTGNDTNGHLDVFVRELSEGTTDLVSRALVGVPPPQANGVSERPSISTPTGNAPGTGTIFSVAFHSAASNLLGTGNDTNNANDVFVFSRKHKQVINGVEEFTEIERVSVSSGEAQANNSSIWPSISANGLWVAFQSQATNLVSGDSNAASDAFVRDLAAGSTTRVSVSSSEVQGNGSSFNPSLAYVTSFNPAQNTVRVAFTSSATNLVSGDTNAKQDVFVRNQTAGTTERASVGWSGAQGTDHSGLPSISPDGRYIGFHSRSANLVVGDTNAVSDVFVRDRVAAPNPPETQIDSGPPDLTGSTNAAFAYSGTPVPSVSHFECSLDGAPFASCPGAGTSFSDLANGPHSFAVRAVDPGGTPDATPATYDWTIDISRADIELSATPAALDIRQGRSKDVAVSIARLNGSDGNVSFTAGGLPEGVSAAFAPDPVSGTGASTTLKLTASGAAPTATDYATVTIIATPAGDAVGIAPRTITVLVRVTPDCEPGLTLDYLDVRAPCIFRLDENRYRITGNADVNGLELTAVPNPSGNPALTIDTAARTVESSAKYAIAVNTSPAIPFHATEIEWDLGGTGTGPKQVEDAQLSGLKRIFNGLPIERVKVALTKDRKAIVTPTLKLGFWPFNTLFGALTSTATFTTSNDGGANFTGLELTADKIEGVGVRLKNVNLKWSEGDNWFGKANIALLFVSPASVDGEFSIKSGEFDFLRARTSTLNKPIGGSIFLQRLGFEATGSPPLLRGDIELTAGPQLVGEAAIAIDGSVEARFGDPFRITVKGVASLADRFELAEVEARYASTGVFEIFGRADWDLRVGSLDIGVLGWVDGKVFNLEGSGRGCIHVKYAPDPCAGVAALVSSEAIAGCIEVAYVSGGIAYVWGDGFDAFGGFGGCSLERFRPARPAAVPAAAEAHSFALPAGLPVAVIRVRGEGDAPAVTLTGPSGESLVVSPEQSVVNQGRLSGLMSIDNSTYLTIQRPGAGRWTVTPAEGTVPVAGVEVARGLPRPRVKARVTGQGRTRTLRWRLRKRGGQQVTFAEIGRDVRNVIKSTSKPRGAARFDLAQGPGGRRRIVALVDQGGFPQANLKVASFKAPSTLRPAKPRKVRIGRKGSRLVVRWRAPRRRGFRHAVYLKLGDGRRLIRVVGPKARKLKVPRVGRRVGAKVKVAGLTRANGRGPAAKAKIKGERRKKGRCKGKQGKQLKKCKKKETRSAS